MGARNNPHATSISSTIIETLTQKNRGHEKEKKDKYNQSMIDIEKSSFNPLVSTTCGGHYGTRDNKRLAEKIAEKHSESHASVMT